VNSWAKALWCKGTVVSGKGRSCKGTEMTCARALAISLSKAVGRRGTVVAMATCAEALTNLQT